MESKRILRPRQIADKVGCSVSHYYSLVKKGDFPPPSKISPNISGTLESEIDEWIAAKIKAARSQEVA